MHSSIVKTLGFYFLLYQRVSTLQNSFLKNLSLLTDEDDETLRKFLVEFNEFYLRNNVPRQVTMIGASPEQLRQAQSSWQEYPYIVCTEPKRCVHRKFFSTGSFFVSFINDLGFKTVQKHVDILSGCKSKCKYLFVYGGKLANGNDVSSFFLKIMNEHAVYYQLAHLSKDTVTMLLPVFLEDCTFGVTSVIFPRPVTNSRKMYDDVFGRVFDLNGCPTRLGTMEFMPQMAAEKNKNGSLIITGGREGMLMLLISNQLNFRIVLKYPPSSSGKTDPSRADLVNEVIAGNTEFAIGGIRPTNDLHKEVEFSNAYDNECITWAVPYRINNSKNLLWAEFPLREWLLVVLAFALTCIIEYIRRNMNYLKKGDRRDVGFSAIFFDVVAINLGLPVNYVCLSTRGRLMLTLCLFYAIVVTTGYKTSLASILTTAKSPSAIGKVKDMLEANLKIGGSPSDLGIFEKPHNTSSAIATLLERYEIINDSSEALHRLKVSNDFCYLGRRSVLINEMREMVRAGEIVTFNIFDSCVLTHSKVIVFPKGSFFREIFNKIIQRVIESGIAKYWDLRAIKVEEKNVERENAERLSGKRTRQSFSNIFIFYYGCLFLCTLVFFAELIIPKFQLTRKRRL